MAQALSGASEQVVQTRVALGIVPSRLAVLEFLSVNNDLREVLDQRLGAWIVDERTERGPNRELRYALTVQFPNQEVLDTLIAEGTRYGTGQIGELPTGIRRSFFDALQGVRPLSREDRTGVRLRRLGLPDQDRFYLDVDLWHPGSEAAA
jgi:hypothetical protein